jgi:hypothetical protein
MKAIADLLLRHADDFAVEYPDRATGRDSVAFIAGSDGGAPVTNYEYSLDGGDNWTTRDPVSTSSPLVITGLANGTTYEVRIRALNVVGVGAASEAVSGSPEAQPGAE